MKKLKTSDIAAGVGMRIKKGTLEHLQAAHTETAAATIKAMIGNAYNAATIYILYGLQNSTTPPIYTITAGAVFYNGEIYLVDAVTFTATGANVAVLNIVTTYLTASTADPVEFSDGSNHNVHEIIKMVITAGAGGSGLVNFSALTNYFGSANYLDLSATVTLHANLTAIKKTVKKWANGDTEIYLHASINANIAGLSVLMAGVPAGGFIHYASLQAAATPFSFTPYSVGFSTTNLIADSNGINAATYDYLKIYILYKS